MTSPPLRILMERVINSEKNWLWITGKKVVTLKRERGVKRSGKTSNVIYGRPLCDRCVNGTTPNFTRWRPKRWHISSRLFLLPWNIYFDQIMIFVGLLPESENKIVCADFKSIMLMHKTFLLPWNIYFYQIICWSKLGLENIYCSMTILDSYAYLII